MSSAFSNACFTASSQEQQSAFADQCQNENLRANPDPLIPDEIASMGTAAAAFGLRQMETIHGRIVEVRRSENGEDGTLYGFLHNPGKAMAALSQSSGGAAGDSDEPFRDKPLGFFVKGTFNAGDKKRTSNEQGFNLDRKAITFGLDYSFTDNFLFGATAGYSHTNTDFHRNNGRMLTDSGEFALYGSYFLPKDFYVDWIFGYSFHEYDMDRKIQLDGLTTSAKSRPEGDQYVASLGVGKDFYFQEFFFNPYVRVEYLNLSIDSYREKGGSGLGLEVGSQSVKSVTSIVGGQISRAFSMPWGILSPGIRFEWVHQYKNNDRSITARFAGAPEGTGQFAVTTDSPDRNYFNLGGSIAATLPEGRAAFLRYETRLGQRDISDHIVEVSVRIPF